MRFFHDSSSLRKTDNVACKCVISLSSLETHSTATLSLPTNRAAFSYLGSRYEDGQTACYSRDFGSQNEL